MDDVMTFTMYFLNYFTKSLLLTFTESHLKAKAKMMINHSNYLNKPIKNDCNSLCDQILYQLTNHFKCLKCYFFNVFLKC